MASLCIQSGAAIDTSQSGRILDDFKERQKDILFDTNSFGGTGANDIIEQEYVMNWLDALKTRLQAIENVYHEKKSATTAVRASLEEAIKALDTSITNTEQSILDTTTMISQKQIKIQELQANSLSIKIRIKQHRKVILEYLANLYTQGNLVLDDSGWVDIIKGMVLTEDDTDFALSDLTYKTLVMQMGQKFVNDYRDLVRELYLVWVQVQSEEQNLKDVKLKLETQKKNIEAQKGERQRLLEITKWQEALYIQYIASQQQAQAQIQKSWQDAADKYKDSFDELLKKYNCPTTSEDSPLSADCIRIRQFFANEKELAKSALREWTPNILDWPVPSRKITTFFHDPEYYRWLGSQHEAIDIGTDQGTNIVAPADGYVYYTLEPTSGWYSYMAVKHRDGYVTVYGHLSEIVAKRLQFVRKGEVIAKSGWAVGTPGAGPMTSGPHLHFEVWKDQEPVDPLRYLPMADIDYKSLPGIYQDKFIADIVEKSGNQADAAKYQKRFVIKGDTESERQKYLLKMYATKDFQNWDLWVDSALSAKVDPSFLMCIGLAESTLGNHLKTPYNVGNVWNTDDGGTYAFNSPREGIEWMTSTLNNKFLWGYTRVSELSRWWNSNWPIYASSISGWHSNIIRCMSALKWRFVEDGYEFRIK